MVVRKILRIDEDRCNGCGLCIPACAEGALQIVDGKARLVSEKFCDGLGACLGECPNDAIRIEERDAEEFDEQAVEEHLAQQSLANASSHPTHHACPSTKVLQFGSENPEVANKAGVKPVSRLSQWPIQLALIPASAPFFENSELVVAADCVPFAYADFHNSFLKGKQLIIGCPKLDNAEAYKEKLTTIFQRFNIKGVTVVNMEVPCCFGLLSLVKKAIASSGKDIPVHQEVITIKGDTTLSKLGNRETVPKPHIAR